MNNLDNFFDYLLSMDIKRDLKLTKEYPNYREIIKSYKVKLQQSKLEPIITLGSLKGQIYTLPFDLIGGSTFELKINIELLNLLLENKTELNKFSDSDYNKEFRIKVNNCDEDSMDMLFSKDFLSRIVYEDQVDKEYAKKCVNSEEAVICGDFTGLSTNQVPFFILDGNHKAYGKVKAGKDDIRGVLVGRNIWIKALMTEEDKMFIKIFNNINFILSYRNGRILKCDLNKYMYNI
ncbi:hypothetical protein [Clostridium guangxiense]|uniref:hypothetical protein n=1 Tax=Clostridium guangxiense TaxID=1662055 RepID=UPI001E327BAB|nr:hypothetical protein [Clostridium guangxiense]MCD2347184.1 hypothetical protein [Clostridium guangxiense]